jgi:hypothetical protein
MVGTPDNRILVAVRRDFTGAFSGRVLLIFPETSSSELMRAVAGRSLSLKNIVDLWWREISSVKRDFFRLFVMTDPLLSAQVRICCHWLTANKAEDHFSPARSVGGHPRSHNRLPG